MTKHKGQGGPELIVLVLPEASADIYQAIKQCVPVPTPGCLFVSDHLLIAPYSFGDCQQGVATQCLKSNKCSRAKPQYFANVCLK